MGGVEFLIDKTSNCYFSHIVLLFQID